MFSLLCKGLLLQHQGLLQCKGLLLLVFLLLSLLLCKCLLLQIFLLFSLLLCKRLLLQIFLLFSLLLCKGLLLLILLLLRLQMLLLAHLLLPVKARHAPPILHATPGIGRGAGAWGRVIPLHLLASRGVIAKALAMLLIARA